MSENNETQQIETPVETPIDFDAEIVVVKSRILDLQDRQAQLQEEFKAIQEEKENLRGQLQNLEMFKRTRQAIDQAKEDAKETPDGAVKIIMPEEDSDQWGNQNEEAPVDEQESN